MLTSNSCHWYSSALIILIIACDVENGYFSHMQHDHNNFTFVLQLFTMLFSSSTTNEVTMMIFKFNFNVYMYYKLVLLASPFIIECLLIRDYKHPFIL